MKTSKRQAPKGILGFPVAPMNAEGKLDLDALGKNIEFLIDGGLSSIFVACGAGELHAISNEEYRSMVEVAVKKTQGKGSSLYRSRRKHFTCYRTSKNFGRARSGRLLDFTAIFD